MEARAAILLMVAACGGGTHAGVAAILPAAAAPDAGVAVVVAATEPEPVPLSSDGDFRAVRAWLDKADAEIARVLEKDEEEASSNGWGREGNDRTMPPRWCKRALALTKAPESCVIYETGLGRAAVLIVTTKCTDEHCDVRHYVVTDSAGPRRVTATIELGHLVVTADGLWGFAGSAELQGDGEYAARMVRIELATMKAEEVAACADPELSPAGRWIVCRDIGGDVVRMPSGSGDLELVHHVDLDGRKPYRDPHVGVGLAPVLFLSATSMRVVTDTDDGQITRELPWTE